MKSSVNSLQTAIFNRLTTDAALTAKVTGVFDDVTPGQAYPYVTLGEDTSADGGTKTFDGEDVTKTLHVWSRYDGKKEAQEILSLVLESMTREPLLLSGGFSVQFSQLEMLQVFTDADGITRHGVMRLRFRVRNS
ncbi:DUF3168 domain-containing protein [Paradesulfitobacterium aromaticivorans]